MTDRAIDSVKFTKASKVKDTLVTKKAGANKSKSTTAPYSLKPKMRK